MRFVISALLVGLGIVGAAAAQTRPVACGTLPEDIASVEDFAPYFFDPEMAAVRGEDLEQLSPTEPHYVVTDSTTCATVHARARTYLQASGGAGINLESGEYEFTVFRFGPYYAIALLNDSAQTPDVETGFAPLIVFRADDLTHLLTIAT